MYFLSPKTRKVSSFCYFLCSLLTLFTNSLCTVPLNHTKMYFSILLSLSFNPFPYLPVKYLPLFVYVTKVFIYTPPVLNSLWQDQNPYLERKIPHSDYDLFGCPLYTILQSIILLYIHCPSSYSVSFPHPSPSPIKSTSLVPGRTTIPLTTH